MIDDKTMSIGASDTVVSLGDIAYAGTLLSDPPTSARHLAKAIASFSHLLTTIVLSGRIMVFGDSESFGKPPISLMYSLLTKHCNVLTVPLNDSHPAMDVFSAVWKDPTAEFDLDFCVSAIESDQQLSTGVRLPDSTRYFYEKILDFPEFAPLVFEQLPGIKATLAEYALSKALSLPFTPNPALSVPIIVHELREKTAKDDLVSLLDDMRHESATLYDLSRKHSLDIRRDANIYCLRLPAIFMSIVNQSNDVAGAISIAANMSSDAKDFREWCNKIETVDDPNAYLDRLLAAKGTLERLGRAIDAREGAELTLGAGPVSTNLPAPKLRKLINYLNVDLGFFRSRRFLINVLSQARQISSVEDRLGRLCGVDEGLAKSAARIYVKSAAATLDLGVARVR